MQREALEAKIQVFSVSFFITNITNSFLHQCKKLGI